MFEAECPSCNASYQVDERRVPPTGLKMRCPKCGESFQVTAPAHSDPPVLGAALGLKKPPTNHPPRHKQTMLGVAEQGGRAAPSGGPPRPGAPGRAGIKKTMMGVAPEKTGGGFELASLDDDEPDELDADELDLSSTGGGELDLGGAPDDGEELDLPSPSSRAPAAQEAELPSLGGGLPDLPSPAGEMGLPELPGGGADLPAPAEAGLPDLNAGLPEVGGAGLPEVGGAGLPEIGGAGLPDLGGELPDIPGELPTVGGNLPVAADQLPNLLDGPEGEEAVLGGVDPFADGSDAAPPPPSFDFDGNNEGSPFELTNPPPAPSGGAPNPDVLDDAGGMEADDIFGQGPTHAPQSMEPPAPGTGDPSAFGEVNLGGETAPMPGQGASGLGADLAGGDDEGEFDAFPTDDTGASAGSGSVGDGGGYGDVALDAGGGAGAALDLGDEVDHGPAPDGAVPAPAGGAPAAATAQVKLPESGEKKDEKAVEKKKRRKTSGLSKGTRLGLGAALIFAVGGGALSLVPDIGPYGAYLILDTINSDSHAQALAADIKAAQGMLRNDTADDVARAFSRLESGRETAPRLKPRKAYAAFLGYFHQLRFGASTDVSTQAKVILGELKEADPNTKYLALAQLAQKAASGKYADVVKASARNIKRGPEFAAIVGEAAIRIGNAEVAQRAWEFAQKAGPSAQAHFGMARAMQLAKKPEEARQHMDQALTLNANHAGARLLLAQIQLRSREFDEEIVKSLTPLSQGKGASKGEQVSALSILGNLHLTRKRLKKAEAAFKQALKLDSGSASAQSGLAQTLFESGRFSDALARFEAALAKAPDDLATNLGLVQCKLRLEKLDDAVKHLAKLREKHPKSSAVAYWEGRGRESVGDKEEAEKAYERAIELDEEGSELVLSYIALTRLLSQKGNLEEASEVISQAEEKFPDDPTVYEALAELSTSRGSYDEAVRDYDKALRLDPKNIGLRFARGIALRQARRFDEAGVEFDFVEKQSPDYPGLALERGNLFQASGRAEEALRMYEQALAAAPDDDDLKLRVACGKADAGQSDPVIELLAPVLEKRANSAEVNFCQGLALLNKDDFPNAKTYLGRAVAQDATRAKYHLYVGWVALEMKDLAQATASLDKTIELDRTLADAYWKRGDLRVRSGAVKDALGDINKALEIAPERLEPHAVAALAYEQLGSEQEAMASWDKAVSSKGVNPVWHFQYGKLLQVNRRTVEAQEQLKKAIEGVAKAKHPPVWLPNAHRFLAMAIGRRMEAVKHWKFYMEAKQGTPDPYLQEALGELDAILKMQGQ